MGGSLNKVMLIGNLGDDIKMHHFEDGGCVGRFPLATNESYISKQTGEKVSNTEWHNVVVRNKAAEICNKYLKKGDKVYVEGKLKTRKWQAEDGQQRYSTEVHVNEFNFLISHLVPKLFSPFFLTETFTSALRDPSCIFPSQVPRYLIMLLSFLT